MRIDITIYADSSNELANALAQIHGTLSASAFDPLAKGFRIEVTPSYEDNHMTTALPGRSYVQRPIVGDGNPSDFALGPTPGEDENLPPAQDAVPPRPPRTRRTKAQIEADNLVLARASSANGGTPPAPQADADTPDTPASPADAKLRALEILRECYTQPGGPDKIKQVQKDFAVGKFIEVPDSRGIELYERAVALHGALNL
jgi:hypothetical protein